MILNGNLFFYKYFENKLKIHNYVKTLTMAEVNKHMACVIVCTHRRK